MPTRIRGKIDEKLVHMKISLNKAACMSHILMLVSTGYRYWIAGEMDYSKAVGFSKKMAELYPVDATADQRAWAKKNNRYSAHLIMYPHCKDKTKIMFWLLATAGGAPKRFIDIHEREKMKNAAEHPLRWRDQYQCLLSSRAGKNKQSWSWSMQPIYFSGINASAKEAADSGASALASLFDRLAFMPMFSGIRYQLKDIASHADATWKKRRKSPCPSLLPNPLPVMPKIKVWGDLTLEILIETKKKSVEESHTIGTVQAAEVLGEITKIKFI